MVEKALRIKLSISYGMHDVLQAYTCAGVLHIVCEAIHLLPQGPHS